MAFVSVPTMISTGPIFIDTNLHDGFGNPITSQVNGGQRALDVGINVAGVQIDPRDIRPLVASDIVTVEQGTSPWVVSGTVTTTQTSSTATLTAVARSVVSQTALASNSSRKGILFHNDSGGMLFLAFAATATNALFTVRLTSQSSYIMDGIPVYTGVISVIWQAGGGGNLLITELT